MNSSMVSKSFIEVSFSGEGIKPDSVKASDIADILNAVEDMVESQVFRDHPEIEAGLFEEIFSSRRLGGQY